MHIIPLARPYIPEEFHSFTKKITKSGTLTKGEFVKIFEEELCDLTGAKYCLCLSSGTAALYTLANLLDGINIYIPAYGFPAAYNCFLRCGKNITPLDVSVDDYNISLDELKHINSYRSIIVPIHQFGYPVDINAIKEKAKSFILEDCACGLFTYEDGKHIGINGDCGILSFHPRKIITTGEGGAILFKDEELYLQAAEFINHGREIPGLNFRMPELNAALGIVQLQKQKYIETQRKLAYNRYCENLVNSNVKLPKYTKDFCPQSFVVVVDGITIERIIGKMYHLGIQVGTGSSSVVDLKYYNDNYSLPNTKHLSKNTISLPFFTEITEEQIDYVCKSLLEVVNDI